MALLARIVKRTEMWSLYDEQQYWEYPAFPFPLLSELGREPSVSFYEVNSEDDVQLHRIAAAWILAKNADDKYKVREFGFRFVKRSFITSKLELQVEQTKGKTRDDLVNKLHFQVDFPGNKAVSLLRELRKRAKTLSMQEVGKAVIESIDNGWAQGAKYEKELISTLFKAGLLVKKVN